MEQNYNNNTFLAKWLSNDLSSKELSDFKKSEDYKLYQKIANKSTEFKVPKFNETEVFDKIQSKIKLQKTKVKEKKHIPMWIYSVAAVALLILGISFFFNTNTSYISETGQQLAYVLPDGSEVKLNGASSIKFKKTNWNKGNRILQLEGEAYFKVKKGSTFSVETKEGTVTVLGTQFNVQTSKNYLAVECYKGKVGVKNHQFETVLTPGKGTKYSLNEKVNYTIESTEPNWFTHAYSYNGVPLNIVFKDLQNVYRVTFQNNKVDLSQKYSGKLVLDDLEKALKVICAPMDIQYQKKDKMVFISL